MAKNGSRRPPRPRIELLSPAATPEEAAAVTAAISRFLAEHAPAPSGQDTPVSRWQRAALLEGVERAPEADVWGGPPR